MIAHVTPELDILQRSAPTANVGASIQKRPSKNTALSGSLE